jgi:hypothetical protein
MMKLPTIVKRTDFRNADGKPLNVDVRGFEIISKLGGVLVARIECEIIESHLSPEKQSVTLVSNFIDNK